MKTRRRVLGGSRLAMAVTLALLLGACAAAATPTPVPTPTPSPSPTPVDVEKAFLAAINVPNFSARSTVTGMLTLGALTLELSGSQDFSGKDNHSTTVVGNAAATESLRASGADYKRIGDGPWIEQPAAGGTDKDLSTFLATLAALEDIGVESKAGRQLHHLRAPPSVKLDPAAIGFSDPSMSEVTATIDFYAEDDGTPAVFSFAFSWKQDLGGTTVDADLTLDLVLVDVGKPVEIKAPDVIWTTFVSDRFGYSMAHPKDWEVSQTDPTGDSFLGAQGAAAFFGRDDLPAGSTLNQYTNSIVALNKADGGSVESNDAYVIAGIAGRLLVYHITLSGQPYHVLYVLTVSGSHGYQVVLYSPAGTELDDRVLLDQFVSTFKIEA